MKSNIKGLSKFRCDSDRQEYQRVLISGLEYVPGSCHKKENMPNISHTLGQASRLLLEITRGLGRETKAELQPCGLQQPQECWREEPWRMAGHTGLIQCTEAECTGTKGHLSLVALDKSRDLRVKSMGSKSRLCCLLAVGLWGIN